MWALTYLPAQSYNDRSHWLVIDSSGNPRVGGGLHTHLLEMQDKLSIRCIISRTEKRLEGEARLTSAFIVSRYLLNLENPHLRCVFWR